MFSSVDTGHGQIEIYSFLCSYFNLHIRYASIQANCARPALNDMFTIIFKCCCIESL